MKIRYNPGAWKTINKKIIRSLVSNNSIFFKDRDYLTVEWMWCSFDNDGFCKDLKI